MRTFKALAALCAGLLTNTVPAATSASFVLGPVTVQLTDLDPFDGIAPSITWLPGSAVSLVQASETHDFPDLNKSFSQSGTSSFGPVSGSLTSPYANSTISISGGDGVNPSGVTFSGTASAFSAPSANESTLIQAGASSYFFPAPPAQFSLTANTQVSFQAFAVVEADVGSMYLPPGYGRSAGASVSLNVGPAGDHLAGGGQTISESLFVSSTVTLPDWIPDGITPDDHQYAEGSVLLTFSNTTSATRNGEFWVSAIASGFTSVTTVPEPGAVAMFTSGLALLGVVARRRRSAGDRSR